MTDNEFVTNPSKIDTSSVTIILEDRDYTVKEVALLFGCHPEQVKRWLRGTQGVKMNGRIENNRWLVTKDEIIAQANRMYGSTE